MAARDVRAAVGESPVWTAEDGTASFWWLASFNDGMVWVGRYTGESPWERHSDADELIHVLEGEVEVVVVTDGRCIETVVPAGSVFVVPRGQWHKQRARAGTLQLGVTTGPVEHSAAEAPPQS
jgi:quercetin dioxygenase-like cupin family protein